ncbi:MAG: rod shape-determining protein MreC [Jatrophihabitantaceae bacterium]
MRRLTRRQRTAAIVLAALALCFITLDLGGGGLRSAHTGVRGALGSLYRGTDAMLGPVRRFVQGVPSAGTNVERIRTLQHENAQLRGDLSRTQIDHATRARLAALQLAADSGHYRVMPARVLALGPGEGFDWTLTLDAGTRDGVRAGQSVTDGDGLVGRVLHADANSSAILLAADPGSGVGARDLRSGEIGLATGAGTDGFTFVPLNPKASIRVGDKLSTGPSGSTSFVPGLMIGTVSSVRASADGTIRATVRAATSPTSVDLVGVILVGGHTETERTALHPTSAVAESR